MKERVKGFGAGVLVSTLVFAFAGGALAASRSIEIDPINIQVNGEVFKPIDGAGREVLVFAYNGTTYAPLRALANAYGLEVGYDAAANMATVNKPSASTLTLGIGTYTVGADIAPGKYDVTALSGYGNFQGDVSACQFGSLNEVLAAPGASDYYQTTTYSNLTLSAGDVFYIKGSLELQFVKK